MNPPEYNKHGVTVRAATWLDVEQMAERLRKSDKEEIQASSGLLPGDGLRRAFHACTWDCRFVISRDLVPVVMFGTTPVNGGQSSIWMLATDEIDKIKRSFHEISKAYIAYFLTQYNVLYNLIDVRNAKTRKWLGRCGAQFLCTVAFGPENREFEYFRFVRGK